MIPGYLPSNMHACDNNYNLSPAQIKHYNKLLDLRMQGIKQADKKWRKLIMGGVPYSKVVQNCQQEITLWNAALTRKKGCKYSSRKIWRLKRKCNLYNTHLHSEEWLENKLLQAKKHYKEKKKEADKLRLKFLEDKAQAIADEGNLELAAIYKQLI